MKKFIKNNFTNRNNGDAKTVDLKENFIFQDFVDYAAIGIFKMNPDTVIEYANQSLAQILDYKSRSKLIGINFKDELISDSTDWEKIRAKLLKHRIAKNFIIPLKQNSGASIFVRVDIRAASNTAGELSHFEGSVTDVSDFVKSVNRIKKELEAVKEEKNNGDAQMIVPTAVSNKYLSETLHKLKTPINSIVGFLTLIEQGLFNSEDELKDFSHKARVSANSLVGIIDNINKKLDGNDEKKPEKQPEAKQPEQKQVKVDKAVESKSVPKEEIKKEVAKPKPAPKTIEPTNGNSAKKVPDNGKKILLVEDNPISQNVEMRLLKESGYSVVAVTSGEDAVAAVKTQEFSLVLMDVEMPNMDGIKATKLIRELDPPVNQVPIIAVTAHSSMKDRERCLASGMNDYIAKPININFMRMTIDQWLKRNVEG